jgi:hypothetical protein
MRNDATQSVTRHLSCGAVLIDKRHTRTGGGTHKDEPIAPNSAMSIAKAGDPRRRKEPLNIGVMIDDDKIVSEAFVF